MSTTLLATFRITLTYSYAALAHKLHVYVDSPDTATPYHVIQRDTTTITFALAAQGLWDSIKKAMDSTVLGASVIAELQQLTGVSWNTVEVASVSGNGSGSGAGTIFGEQTTITLKDLLFRPLRIILLETKDPFNNRVTAAAAGNNAQGVALEFTSGNTVTHPPYMWVMSRGLAYLAPSGTLTSIVWSSNRKVRRARGIA